MKRVKSHKRILQKAGILPVRRVRATERRRRAKGLAKYGLVRRGNRITRG